MKTGRRKKHRTIDPEAARLLSEILLLSITITYETDAEIFCEYHGNYDSLRVYCYTRGEKHFKQYRNMMESRWISKDGGNDIFPEYLRPLLEDLKAFGKEVGYDPGD